MKSMSPPLFIGGTYEVGEKPTKATYVFARGSFNKYAKIFLFSMCFDDYWSC